MEGHAARYWYWYSNGNSPMDYAASRCADSLAGNTARRPPMTDGKCRLRADFPTGPHGASLATGPQGIDPSVCLVIDS